MGSSALTWIRRLLGGGLLLWMATLAARAADPRPWAFVGVWDRSMPLIDAACREEGVSAAFFDSHAFADSAKPVDAASYEMVFVLNLAAEDAPRLTERLKQSRAQRPGQRVLPLDTRGSQSDLDKAGLLLHDDAVIKYWRPNGPVNVRRMVQYCLQKYFSQPGATEPPVMIPEAGYYEPEAPDAFEKLDDYIRYKTGQGRWQSGAPVAALIIQQSFWITHDLKVVDAEVRALERQHLNAVVVFGDREPLVAALIRAAKPDLLIEDRHGPMWENGAFLKELDLPYLRPISMLASTVDEWRRDPRGFTPRDIGLFMSLQESWGTIEPLVVGGLEANLQGFKMHEPIPDRIEAFAARAARWAALRRKPNSEKKVAIIYYNKGLGQDDLMRGSPTGGFLDAPQSLLRFLPKMKEAGYQIEQMPASSADLIAAMRKGGRNIGPWAQGDLEKLVDEANPILIPASTYQHWFETKLSPANQKSIIDRFGPPPGRLMVVTRNGEPQIVLPRIDLGHVLLLPQPERGEQQDETLLHNRDLPPPHNYLAFYWWLDEELHADAVVHWGTHGTLELLPGKEAGLSRDCWSDLCAGHLPIVDLWITDNLGEATLSRRRSYSELVDHLPPPAMDAGLQNQFRTLHDEIHKLRSLEPGVLKEEFRRQIAREVREAKLDWPGRPGALEELPSDEAITALDDHLHNIYEAQTPLRLHVLGEGISSAEIDPYLVAILGSPFLAHLDAARVSAAPIPLPKPAQREQAIRLVKAAAGGGWLDDFRRTPELTKDLEFAEQMRGKLRSADQEITGLLRALDGRYIEPGPGPDPIRNPASVPTGRDLYALNPEEIPTRAAWEVGSRLVDDLLRRRQPKKIAMDLNGMDTMRDFGVMEAQILALLGVRPVWDRNNLAIDVELIPAAELKRPRVDVFIAMGGMYKENFPSRVSLLDKAVRLAAAAPEPANPVRDGAATVRDSLLQRGFSSARAAQLATARIFGTKPGNMSGTNILYLVPRSGVWDKDDEIASVYMDNMSFAYTGEVWGEQIDGLYESALQGADTVLRVWASNMTSQLSNHHAYEYLGGLSLAVRKVTGKTPVALIADVRDPSGAKIRDFEEVLATNLQSELLNPKWIAGMKEHDYAGAGHMSELVKNTFGWSVTRPESIGQETWSDIYETYINDRAHLGLTEWFERVSPHAMQEITATMLEASRKGFWKASRAQIEELSRRYAESVRRHGDSGGLVSGGNTRLVDYAAAALRAGGAPADASLAAALQQSLAASAAPTQGQKVVGPKLEPAAKAPPTPNAQASATPTENPAKAAAPRWHWEWVAAAAAALLLFTGFFRRTGAIR